MKFALMNFVSGIIEDNIGSTNIVASEPTVVYFLEGNFSVTVGDTQTKLTANRFMLLNAGEVADIEAHNSSNMVLQLSFNLAKLDEVTAVGSFNFETKNHRVLQDEELDVIIVALLKTVLSQDHQLELIAIGKSYELLNLLMLKYGEMKPTGNDQVLQIKRYIELHYSEALNLKRISGVYYMEPSYFSRYFKKNIGINFKDYLTGVRLNHSEVELKRPDTAIAQVALACGFSSLSSFNRAFKQKFKITPSQFREKHAQRPKAVLNPHPDNADMIQRANALLSEYSKQINAKSNIELHISEQKAVTKQNPNMAMILNFGEIKSLERVDWKADFRRLTQTTTFKYARVRFNRESLETIDDYGLNFLNQIIDECMLKGVIPWLTFKLQEDTISEQALDGITLICRNVADHLAVNVVSLWPFEVENDSGQVTAELLNSYRRIKATLRQTLPNVQVGGLGENALQDASNDSQYVQDVDFVTLRSCVQVGKRVSALNSNLRRSRQQLVDFFEVHQFGATPVFITELGLETQQTNYLQDSMFAGAYFLQQVMAVMDKLAGCGSVLGSDAFGSHSHFGNTPSAGMGMITTNGISKPSLQAVKFLNEFSRTKQIVQLDAQYFAGFVDTDVYILGNNLRYPLLTDDFDPENPRLVNDRLLGDIINISVALDDVADGTYEVRMFQCRGDVLSKWEKFDFYRELRNSDIGLMSNQSDVEVSLNMMKAKAHHLLLKYTIEANNYFMIHLRKKNEILDSDHER